MEYGLYNTGCKVSGELQSFLELSGTPGTNSTYVHLLYTSSSSRGEMIHSTVPGTRYCTCTITIVPTDRYVRVRHGLLKFIPKTENCSRNWFARLGRILKSIESNSVQVAHKSYLLTWTSIRVSSAYECLRRYSSRLLIEGISHLFLTIIVHATSIPRFVVADALQTKAFIAAVLPQARSTTFNIVLG